MALAGNNITPRLARTEMGSEGSGLPTTNLAVHDVCRRAGQNEFSFYGPWHLDTSGNKDCEIDYQTSDDKLGDFRLYNHSATTPKPQDDYTQYWGPGGSTVDFYISAFPYDMNILDALNDVYATSALRLCFKFYSSSVARGIGTSPVKTSYTTLIWNTLSGASLMAGHTRSQTQKAGSTQFVEVTGVPTTYSVLYLDTYISDASGNRLLNLGTNVASGYTDITFVENSEPEFRGSFITIGSPPLTGAHIAISSDSARCSDATPVEVSVGTAWSIWTRLKGQVSTYQTLAAATSVTVRFRHYTSVGALLETDTRTGQTFSNSSAKQFSGTWSDTMAYGNYVVVDVTAITWGATGSPC